MIPESETNSAAEDIPDMFIIKDKFNNLLEEHVNATISVVDENNLLGFTPTVSMITDKSEEIRLMINGAKIKGDNISYKYVNRYCDMGILFREYGAYMSHKRDKPQVVFSATHDALSPSAILKINKGLEVIMIWGHSVDGKSNAAYIELVKTEDGYLRCKQARYFYYPSEHADNPKHNLAFLFYEGFNEGRANYMKDETDADK